jgi:apolipoprotein N-acyltransferase
MLQKFPMRCGMAVLSGVTFAMAYPPLGWGWLVFPGLVGLLLALRGQHGTRARTIGFLHGMAMYGVGVSWLFHIFSTMAVALWCVLAAFTALFAEMQSRASLRGVTGWQFAVFTALNWCGWEFIRAELFPLRFPWMTAGLAMGPNSLLPWIGVYGVSILVVLIAILLTMRFRKFAIAPFAILLSSYIFLSPSSKPQAEDPLAVSAAGVQLEGVSMDAYVKATRDMPKEVRLAVWPEYAVPFDLQANLRDLEMVKTLCRDRNITLTLGTQNRAAGDDAWHNIALTLDPTGILGEHTKVHPVHFFDDGIPGNTALPVQTLHGKIGTPICFDCDYEGVVRRMTAAGAEFFVVPTMDAESWSARQHDQHAELFRIRACENGRWIFVVATSGVSQLIDPTGHVHARLAALEQGTLFGIFKRETKLTFYTQFGWLTPWVVLALGGACWFFLMLPVRRKSDMIP